MLWKWKSSEFAGSLLVCGGERWRLMDEGSMGEARDVLWPSGLQMCEWRKDQVGAHLEILIRN